MNLKSTFVLVLLLAVAAIPALADDQMATETVKDVGIHADNALSTSTAVHQEVALPPASDELLPALAEGNLFEASTTSRELTCEEIDGTPCSSSESCGSCYPTPSCPLTPCYCGYGVCQCDI